MPRVIDIIGMKYGSLTVEERVENSIHNAAQYKCRCDCGNYTIQSSNALRTGHTLSCGCQRKVRAKARMTAYNTKHGDSRSRLYIVWTGVRQRVENPHNDRYKDYGGRGITICEEWTDFETFKKWAIENGYDENAKYGDCTLDRIDVNGNYEPSNCRWVDLKVQANNKRKKEGVKNG